MSWLDIIRTALAALRGNWLRSALTSLGVIIGIAAVIVMVSIGQGTQKEIDKLVSGLGSQRLDIGSAGGQGGGARLAQGSRWSLNSSDVDSIRSEIPEVQYVSGSLRGGTQVVNGENNASTQWQGVDNDWFAINDWTLANGDGFEPRDYTSAVKKVVIGETVRKELFGDGNGIGQSIRIGRVPFTVSGTLAPKGQGGFGQDQDDIVVVPLETARRRLSTSNSMPPGAVQGISVGVDSAKNLDSAQNAIEGLLRQRHKIQPGTDDDFVVRNISQIVATRTATTNLMSKLLGAVAGICLIIGGIGIMNIMLVSVTERIREIGLRMSVGAGPRDVRRQFLAEAMLISLIGGVIGIGIGVIGALVLSKVGQLPVELNAQVVLLAAAFSMATGLFFGYYPARKASMLDPIEALRSQ
ncbi:ABC transporter permease [Solilutibacter silvestris]|uniref:ABC-type antimicrobial peptide transport system permease component n=1 Tax=Solilutibacter silvestris TaxID=1645665 RepID=A0A2K1PXI4_9GAMM|nr:ABC transporter permease [Lysobacter silvestris]PNS07495.1 ABC-type antimicrobial peptide transport system permease component [Lysobacter silvestris]